VQREEEEAEKKIDFEDDDGGGFERSVDVIYSRFATRAGTWSPCNET